MNIKPLAIKWKALNWLQTMRQSYDTSRYPVYEGTTFTRRYGKLQLAKLMFAWLSQRTLTTRTLWLLKGMGQLLDICH